MGESYPVRVTHLGPDDRHGYSYDEGNIPYNWFADVRPAAGEERQILIEDEPYKLLGELGRQECEEGGCADKSAGNRATVHIPVFDITIDGISDEDEKSDPGAIVWRNSDFSKENIERSGADEEKWLPDYKANIDGEIVWDVDYEEDLTEAKIEWSQVVADNYKLKVTFPSSVLVWNTTGHEGLRDPGRLRSGSTIEFPEGEQEMSLWLEGISSSSAFASQKISIEAVPNGANDNLRVVSGSALKDDAVFTVVDVGIGVDGNRDGQIDFDNHDDRSLLFWFNNDQEGTYSEDPNVEAEVPLVTHPDNQDTYINGKRDLEDLAPLTLLVDESLADIEQGNAGASDGLRVDYKLRAVLDDLDGGVRIFEAYGDGDILSHVTDPDIAQGQVVSEGSTITADEWGTQNTLGSITGGENRFLFEGYARPNPNGGPLPRAEVTLELETTIYYQNGDSTNYVQDATVHLRDITEFYERNDFQYKTLGDARYDLSFEHYPDSIIQQTHEPTVNGKEFFDGDDTVILVHGWNMTDGVNHPTDWKKAFGDTAYKRLYWQGFAGKFVTFNWPTFDDKEGPLDSSIAGKAVNLTYNPSDFQAFRSGRALKNKIQALPGTRKHLLAHSMGNVVASEALRQAAAEMTSPLVTTYVAMESAISAGAFGYAGTDAFDIDFEGYPWDRSVFDNSQTDFLRFVPTDFSFYMQGAKAGSSKWVNIYNPEDIATNSLWRVNNLVKEYVNRWDPVFPQVPWFHQVWADVWHGISAEDLLPPPEIWPYRYVADTSSGKYYRVQYDQKGVFHRPIDGDPDNNPDNLWSEIDFATAKNEMLAFVRQSDGATVGNVGANGLSHFFDEFVDLRGWLPDPLDDPGKRQTHSFQFHYAAAQTTEFWREIKTQTGFESRMH